MSASNKNTTDFLVVKDEQVKVPPLTCPVCGYFMSTASDLFFWETYECCEECGVTWAEGRNKKKWKKGWRPKPEVIKEQVETRRKIIPRLKL